MNFKLINLNDKITFNGILNNYDFIFTFNNDYTKSFTTNELKRIKNDFYRNNIEELLYTKEDILVIIDFIEKRFPEYLI